MILQVWIFPKVTPMVFFWVFLIALGMFAYFKVMNYLNQKQLNPMNHWLELQRFAFARKVNQAEMSLLKKFYDSLSEDLAEFYVQPENRGKLRGALFRFFVTVDSMPTEKEVNLFDKLFQSGPDFQKEITSLHDLVVGEVCALEADGREELTYVLQKTDEYLLLSIKGLSKDLLEPGKEAGLYAFRPSSGGYLLKGVVTKQNKDGIVFKFNGTIEKKGEAHLMLTANYSLLISPWPPKEGLQSLELDKNKVLLSEENLDKQIELLRKIAREQKKNESKAFDLPPSADSFSAISERISDRAITFALPENLSPEIWKIQDLWTCEFSFLDGPTFSIKGKLFPVKQKSHMFLFRYVDADEKIRHEIYEEIKKRGGVRELLN